MLTLKEYSTIIINWFILFLLYYFIFFNQKISIHEALIISAGVSSVISSVLNIKNRTGNTKMYIYSKKTNQKLRYMVFSVTLFIVAFYHYTLFTYMI